jgi:uncharacterized membrane protein
MSRSRSGSPWAVVRDWFRTQLWPLPATGVVLAIVLGVVLPQVEASSGGLAPESLQGYLFSGGPAAARSVLSAVASSLITVTALTFSLTVLTLQLASSQFSPRLLRTFTRDLVVQSILALFLGTFTYSLTVLRTVRSESAPHGEFIPDVAVTVAYVLAVCSVVGLIFFLAHLAQTIRVESMLRSVHQDAVDTADRELGDEQGETHARVHLVPAGGSRAVLAPSSGFLVQVHENDLLEEVVDAGVLAVIDVRPGDSVVAGTPIGTVWNLDAGASEISDETVESLAAAVVTGFERTSVQDVALGLRQLTDVAVKALSPGINDPTTAIHAIGHSSALLCDLATRELGPKILRDDSGRSRVELARPDLSSLLHLAIDQPARYGAAEPDVLSRLTVLLRELAWVCPVHEHQEVRDALSRLTRLVAAADLDPVDRARLAKQAEAVDEAIAGRWS